MKKPTLPKKLSKHPFFYKDALALGLTKYALDKLIEIGKIERLDRGIYIPSNYDDTTTEAQFHLAALRCGTPSCICLLSALEQYHLTDEIPKKVWIMVPQTKRVLSKKLKLIRSRNPNWKIGIHKSNSYWITTIERTLIECLLYKRVIGSSIALDALKNAINQHKVKAGRILEMANKLGVKHRIYTYIETLS